MIEIEEYLAEDGKSPFATWFNTLDPRAAAKVTIALERIERGLLGDVEPVGEGVSERRVNFGPGYRIYFGSVRDKHTVKIVILLGGGTKRRQQNDIENAKSNWKAYKRRRHKGER